ncbi:MAG TPA: hypothetical protein VG457_19830, partial [Planctomycetota bacterium]|nr:hypothetical protein [Planctomycetota bacterium]
MDCRTSPDLIARSLSGNASSQDDLQLRGHLAACPACADLERGLSATWSLLGRLPAVASTSSVPVVARPGALRRRIWAVVAAAAAILVLAANAGSLRTPPVSGTPQAPVAQQPPDVLPKEERQESAKVQETPAPLEKPQVPAPVAPVPAVPETKTVLAPESPAPKPATPEIPERRDPVTKSAPPETRAEEKRVVLPPAPAPLPVVATVGRVEGDVLALSGSLRMSVKAGQKLTAGASLETPKG